MRGICGGPLRVLRHRSARLAIALCSCSLVGSAAASTASAAIPIDAWSNCFLHAYQPSVDGSSYYPSGRVICSGTYGIELQVCANVANGSNWYVVTGSCVPNDSSAEYFYGSDTGDYGKWESGVCGHTYRTGDGAEDSSGSGWPNYWDGYQSSSETQCS